MDNLLDANGVDRIGAPCERVPREYQTTEAVITTSSRNADAASIGREVSEYRRGSCPGVSPAASDDGHCGVIFHRLDLRNKPVASPRDRFDELRCLCVVAESDPKLADVERDVAFLDKAVGPDSSQQKFLFDNAVLVLDEHQQQVIHLWRERNILVASTKRPVVEPKSKFAKSV